MEADILKIIALSTSRYFDLAAHGGAAIGTPYLRDPQESVALDYSAVIGITGTFRGSVYYTAPAEMIDPILGLIGETKAEDQLRADLVGEITNTVAGHAREQLGGGFMISPPFLVKGRPADVSPSDSAPCYIIPVDWRGHRSRLLVTLTRVEEDAA